MRCGAGLILAGALLVFGGSASAQAPADPAADPANRADIRCLTVSYALSMSKDANIKTGGEAMIVYYVGKLDGRAPNTDWGPAVRAMARTLSLSDIQTYGASCGDVVKARMKAMAPAS